VCKEIEMTTRPRHQAQSLPVANYSSAIAKAVEWLGDRYLLAKPINAALGREAPVAARVTAQRRRVSHWNIGNG
jgi:hypothetical protein